MNDLIELSHQLTDLIADLQKVGVWRETIEDLHSAYDLIIEQIECEESDE